MIRASLRVWLVGHRGGAQAQPSPGRAEWVQVLADHAARPEQGCVRPAVKWGHWLQRKARGQSWKA